MNRATQLILIRLPEGILARLRAVVPLRQRNQFVADCFIEAPLRRQRHVPDSIATILREDKWK